MLSITNQPTMKEIANYQLRPTDVPAGARGYAWGDFAISFDGYGFFGSFDACAERARSVEASWLESAELPNDLSELRGCLFFWQRSEHFGGALSDEKLAHVEALLDAIRRIVR